MRGWRKILNFGNGITEILVVQNSAQRWSAPKEGAWKETNCSDQVVENGREKKKFCDNQVAEVIGEGEWEERK